MYTYYKNKRLSGGHSFFDFFPFWPLKEWQNEPFSIFLFTLLAFTFPSFLSWDGCLYLLMSPTVISLKKTSLILIDLSNFI